MSFYLITTSFVTIVLIPARAFEAGGSANGRAPLLPLSTSTGQRVWHRSRPLHDSHTPFAGASAMAGLINVVPRYLPRYGMSPEWGRAIRPWSWSTPP